MAPVTKCHNNYSMSGLSDKWQKSSVVSERDHRGVEVRNKDSRSYRVSDFRKQKAACLVLPLELPVGKVGVAVS